jgi:hypothetical protein
MRIDHRSTWLAAILAAGALLAAGCGKDEEPDTSRAVSTAEGTYAGAVDGRGAYIALISDGERVTGYVCDGRKVSRWLAPTDIDNGTAELVSRGGETLGKATLTADGASGELTLASETHAFSADPATDDAGLYRAAVGEPGKPGFVEAGWIVLADGSVKGVKNSFTKTGADFVVQPAPKFMELGVGFAVDLGPGGRTPVERLGPSFTDTSADL